MLISSWPLSFGLGNRLFIYLFIYLGGQLRQILKLAKRIFIFDWFLFYFIVFNRKKNELVFKGLLFIVFK